MLRLFSDFYKEAWLSYRSLRRQNPNVFTFILYGLLYDMVLNIWKPFGIKFLSRLGGGAGYISLYNALPGIVAAFILIPSSIFISRFRTKKRITTVFFLISRLFLPLISFVPVLPEHLRPLMFVLLVTLMNIPDAISQTALQGVLGNVFEGRMRATAITLRNKFGNIVVPLVTILTGLLITAIPSNQTELMNMYRIFFIVAFIVGLVEVFVFNRFKEQPPAETDTPTSINFEFIKQVFKHKPFRAYLITSITFVFSWQIGWPIVSYFQVETLGTSELWFAIYTIGTAVGSFFSASFWQKRIIKKGNQNTIILAMSAMALNMMMFPITLNVYMMAIVSIYSGFAMVGINSCILNGVLEATPQENKLVYLGVYNTISNISLFIASMASMLLSSFLHIRVALTVVCLMRFGATLLAYLNQRLSQSSSAAKEQPR